MRIGYSTQKKDDIYNTLIFTTNKYQLNLMIL